MQVRNNTQCGVSFGHQTKEKEEGGAKKSKKHLFF